MHLGRTLAFYFALRVAKSILICFAVVLVLIVLIDYLELVNRTYSRARFNAGWLFVFALFRMPTTGDVALPLATLFGALASFTMANRRLELVIARAAGLSAWQFLLPGAVAGMLIGIASTMLYNPLAATLLSRSLEVWSTQMEGAPRGFRPPSGPAWLRQDGPDGESIMGAEEIAEEGLKLIGVTIFLLDENGRFKERVQADTASLEGTEWVLPNARVTASGRPPELIEAYALRTFLNPDQIREALARADAVSFWSLPRLIRIANQASLPSSRFQMQYQMLLARPLLLVAMVLLAGVVSLRFSRLGNPGPLILAGIAAGFLLYVAGEITSDLGSGGVVAPVIAAWLPALMAMLISAALLVRQEDG